jgi:SPP1 gp7 family putative phage head morphogenesis protein
LNAGAKVKPFPTLNMAFDVSSPEAIAWAKRHAALLVQDINREVRKTIRATVVNGLEQGIAPRETASIIREVIGLTERDAGAVLKRRAEWVEQGFTKREVKKKVDAYTSKLIRSRATTIARTETMRAANEGQRQLWRQAQDAGLLTGAEQKVWLVADPCPRCAPLDGEQVGMNANFSVGQDPPLHPRCRCTIGLVP